jgi:putative transcriptional regulator
MTMENKKHSRLKKAMLETAKDMQHAGLMDEAGYGKITLRHLGVKEKFVAESLTGEDIRAMREQAHFLLMH